MKHLLNDIWPFGDLAAQSGGRVSTWEVIGFFAQFIDDARSGEFAKHPALFYKAINGLIFLKRQLTTEEMVLQ